jgi:hypothetical protein
MERQALPEPNLANSDNSVSFKMLPNNPFKAEARHASPEADDAIPEAVGKEFLEVILK